MSDIFSPAPASALVRAEIEARMADLRQRVERLEADEPEHAPPPVRPAAIPPRPEADRGAA